MKGLKDKIKNALLWCGDRLEWLGRSGSWKMLFFMWLVLGIAVLVIGDISRLNYFCVWILLLFEYVDRIIDEDNRGNDDRSGSRGDRTNSGRQ